MNARTHGLTGKPSRADIRSFFCILVGPIQPGDPAPNLDPKTRAALRLAEAEAHLKRVIEAQEYTTDRLYEAEFDTSGAELEVRNLALMLELLPEGLYPDDAKTCDALYSIFEDPRRIWRHDLKLMARYRSEAEAIVRKMRRAYIRAHQTRLKIPKRSQTHFQVE